MRSVFSIDTKLADRRSQLSIVPEVETPKTSTFLDVPGYRRHSEKARPISEITEICDDDIDDDSDHSSIEEDGLSEISEFEEDSEGLSFESVSSTSLPPYHHAILILDRMRAGEASLLFQASRKSKLRSQ